MGIHMKLTLPEFFSLMQRRRGAEFVYKKFR